MRYRPGGPVNSISLPGRASSTSFRRPVSEEHPHLRQIFPSATSEARLSSRRRQPGPPYVEGIPPPAESDPSFRFEFISEFLRGFPYPGICENGRQESGFSEPAFLTGPAGGHHRRQLSADRVDQRFFIYPQPSGHPRYGSDTGFDGADYILERNSQRFRAGRFEKPENGVVGRSPQKTAQVFESRFRPVLPPGRKVELPPRPSPGGIQVRVSPDIEPAVKFLRVEAVIPPSVVEAVYRSGGVPGEVQDSEPRAPEEPPEKFEAVSVARCLDYKRQALGRVG